MDFNLSQILDTLRKAENTSNVDDFLTLAEEAFKKFPQERKIQGILESAKKKYVQNKLHSEVLRNLEVKEDWQSLQSVYLKLLSVFPESKELQNSLKSTEIKLSQASKKEEEKFLQEGIQTIKTLEAEGHLDDAEHACYELLAKIPKNHHLIQLLAHLQKKIDQQIDQALNNYFTTALPLLEEEYKKNKAQFVHI